MAGLRRNARAEQTRAKGPANVPGAMRNRLRSVVEKRPDADYEIVHGIVMLQNPDNVGKARGDWVEPHQVAYFPDEIIRLSWEDASVMIARNVIVPVGDEHAIVTTTPDINERPKDFKAETPETSARRVKVDIQEAAALLYESDSSQRGMGGLRAAGR